MGAASPNIRIIVGLAARVPPAELWLAMREKVRLQKYLASCGVASRRAAEKLILEHRVKVNGKTVVELGLSVDASGADRVEVDDRPVKPKELGVLLLNKPRNVVSTLSDPQGRPTIGAYLTKQYRSYFPVGRLDWESEGLVIFTNDGYLADILLHPRYRIPREYLLRVEGFLHDRALQRLLGGVKLDDGIARASRINLLDRNERESQLTIVVGEGRNRLVRRMLDTVGHPVTSLLRVSHGPFRLGRIKTGEVKRLTQAEYQRMRKIVLEKEVNASAMEKSDGDSSQRLNAQKRVRKRR